MSGLLSRYAHWAAMGPAPALREGRHKLDYCMLVEKVIQQAHRLNLAGCGVGSRLLLSAPPHGIEWVVQLLSGIAAGAGVVLPDPCMPHEVRKASLAELQPEFELDGAGDLVHAGRRRVAATEGPGIWLFTSGTTERPRPYFRSEASLVRQTERVRLRLPPDLARARPTCLCLTPLCHGYGLLNALFMIHRLGGLVIMAEGASAANVIHLVHEYGVAILYAWPDHYRQLDSAGLWPAAKDNELRWCVSSSARLDEVVATGFEDCTGCPIRQQYGTTETGPLCVDSDSPPRGVGCVGRPMAGVEVSILDARGRTLAPGQEGRVAVRLKDVEDPAWLRQTWYFPGDLGRLDTAGRLYLHRRVTAFHDERRFL